MDRVTCSSCGRSIDAAKICGPVRCACGAWLDLPEWRGGFRNAPRRGGRVRPSAADTRLPYSLADRWHALHRWPLRHPDASPAEVAAFFRRWNGPLSCGRCAKHWPRLLEQLPPRLESPEALAARALEWHNRVNETLGRPAWSREECDRVHGAPSVGFVAAAYMQLGGTETWHKTILPRLAERVRVEGLVSTGFHGGDPTPLGCRYGAGLTAAQELARQVDVLVAWGISDLAAVLPADDRPRVVCVHHSEATNAWSNGFVLDQQELFSSIVAINPAVAEMLRRSTDIPVEYIPNAVDAKRITPSGQALELDARPLVVWCARFALEKRLPLAVEAARLMPDYQFAIIGDGPDKPRDPPANVRFCGVLESQADYLARASRFLSTADQEGFGLSIGEAMLAGVPVVATPFGLGERGDLVLQVSANPTPEELAAALRAPADQSRTARARQFIESNHAPALIVERWAELVSHLSQGREKPNVS